MTPPTRPQPPYERLERYELGPEQRLDAIANAEHVREEHDATHGEAEMCGAECIALGLAEFDDEPPAPGDPDPLYHPWSEPEFVTPDPARLRRGIGIGLLLELVAVAVIIGVIVLIATAGKQPGATMSGASQPPATPVRDGGQHRDPDGSIPGLGGDAPQAGAIGTVLYSGTATWYCGQGSPCTRGYGPLDMVAAIDPTLGIAKGERVRVTHEGKSVTVRIVDVCLCRDARLIDLTSGAFLRLASTDLGVIPVTVEVLGATRTLPPTDAAEGTP